MDKKTIRKHFKELRQNLNENEIEDLSLQIANQIISLDIWDKTYFHLFLPIEEQKEINTEYVLQVLAGRDKEIVVSQSDFETRKMTHFLLTENTKIKKNVYNIPEPVDGLEVPVTKIDVVFVPLLAFDSKGNRVGYGKGFYDLFLSECKPETLKIGLSFFESIDLIEDVFESDVSLNYCITPKKIYQF